MVPGFEHKTLKMSEYRSINTKTNQNCKYQKSSSICLFLIDFPSCASSLISLSLSNVTLSQQSWSSSTQDIIYPNIKNWKPSSTHPCTLENHWLRSRNTLLQPYLHRTHHRGPGMHSASFLQTPLTVYSCNIETTPCDIFNTFPVIWNNGGLGIRRTYWQMPEGVVCPGPPGQVCPCMGWKDNRGLFEVL